MFKEQFCIDLNYQKEQTKLDNGDRLIVRRGRRLLQKMLSNTM